MYKTIYEQHDVPVTYMFDEEARQLYVEFSDMIVEEMNRQLKENVILADNLSKGRKIFLRFVIFINVTQLMLTLCFYTCMTTTMLLVRGET
jgi:hypothetical protein